MITYELITAKKLNGLYSKVAKRANDLGLSIGQFKVCTDTPMQGRQLLKMVREYTATLMYDTDDAK